MTKQERQQRVLQAVRDGAQTQQQIMEKLEIIGCFSTQATVSRDLQELGFRKINGLLTQELDELQVRSLLFEELLSRSILSAEGAGNILCLRCAPGLAQSVCAAIDQNLPENVVGSLAGEDTIFLLCRTEDAVNSVRTALSPP